MTLKTKPRILLAMITVGNGHKAPADAIKAGIERLYPNQFEIDVLDFTREVGDLEFDRRHKASWDWMLERPRLTYWGQRFIDTLVPVWATRGVQAMMLRSHAANAAKFVKAKKYDLMVATHFFTVQALAMARMDHGVTTPLIGLNTDPFDAHVMWAEQNVSEMLVSSELAKQKLERKGVPASKISIFGYPLGLQFLDIEVSQNQARTELGLLSDKLTILQSSGAEGIGGQLDEFVRAVLSADLDVQYVVACGRNTKLMEHLQSLASEHTGKVKLVPQGFITNMQTWIAASDLVLGKAGAATTFEALAIGRPIFHTSYVAYNEKTNMDYCIEHGIGKYIAKPEALVTLLEGFLRDRQELNNFTRKVQGLHLRAGTIDISEHLVKKYLFKTTNTLI